MEFKESIDGLIRQAIAEILQSSEKGVRRQATFSDIVASTQQTLDALGCRVLEQIVGEIERSFDANRDKHRVIIRNKNKSRNILTTFGAITLPHTLYFDKDAGRYFFAVDELLQIEKYSRIEYGLQAKLVADATATSFGKASRLSGNVVSRQTVHNLVRRIKSFDAPMPKTKWEAKDIYIEADEDHIHLNDGTAAEMKLVYVHEGTDNTKGRATLTNPRYFVSIDTDADTIWNDVESYLLENYRAYKARVHLSGDGAAWIKAGIRIMPHVEYHLDKFHLQKAILNISRGNKPVQRKLRSAIYSGIMPDFLSTSKDVCDNITDTKTRCCVQENVLYIRGNMPYISRDNRCSAEGHVSHVLSSRLSSRPMAWSKDGAERMAKLRAYLYNAGDFLELMKRSKAKDFSTSDSESQGKRRYCQPMNYVDGLFRQYETPSYPVAELSKPTSELAQKLKLIINN